MTEEESLVDTLRRARVELLDRAGGYDERTLRTRPVDGEWSVIEVLTHLIDVDRHWLTQALAIRDDPRHVFVPFDDDRWKREHPDVRAASPAAVLHQLAGSHRAVVETLARIRPDELERTGRHPRGHAYSVADVFRRYPVHDRNHMEQIDAIIARVRG